MLLQHLVEIVHTQGVQAAVGVGPHGGRAPPLGEQADLWAEEEGLTLTWATAHCFYFKFLTFYGLLICECFVSLHQ